MLKKILFLFVLALIPFQTHAQPSQEYEECYTKAQNDNQVALCMKAETARVLKDIQEVYTNLANNPQTKSWNNGNGLLSGNLKDMYDHWIAYRNRYCSLFVKASENTFGSESFDQERCLLELTDDHYKLVLAAIVNANSGSEEGELDHEHE